MVEILYGRVVRATAASTPGRPKIYLTITPSGGYPITFLNIHIVTNTVGDSAEFIAGASLTLMPGDSITVYTSDDSTGGTVDYSIGLKITEFDA